MSASSLGSAVVVGTGLIGTSIALALRRAGVQVRLHDANPQTLADAVWTGAGRPLTPGDRPADLVVLATPPAAVPAALRDAQRRRLGAVYTDVASTKSAIIAEAAGIGCDLAAYVPGHPMAGRELAGPLAASADLFENRPWALCPGPETAPEPVRVVTELTELCGARSHLIASDAHDRVVAAVSHTPMLISAALAARFAADPSALALAGNALREMTRVAGSPSDLWKDILRQNAAPVAEVLEQILQDLAAATADLRGTGGRAALEDLLRRGVDGHGNIVREPAALAVPDLVAV